MRILTYERCWGTVLVPRSNVGVRRELSRAFFFSRSLSHIRRVERHGSWRTLVEAPPYPIHTHLSTASESRRLFPTGIWIFYSWRKQWPKFYWNRLDLELVYRHFGWEGGVERPTGILSRTDNKFLLDWPDMSCLQAPYQCPGAKTIAWY